MTVRYSYNLLHIGKLDIIDTDERAGHANGENVGVVAGQTFSSGLGIVDVVANDVDGDGVLNEDTEYYSNGAIYNRLQEWLSYESEDGPEQSVLDYSAVVNVTLTDHDGSTRTENVVLTQLQNGDTFLGEVSSRPGGLSNISIASVRINRIVSQNSNGDTLSNPTITNTRTVCFVAGTVITTPHGEALIEDLRPGDKVMTRDGRSETVLWRGAVRLGSDDLGQNPALRPIRIAAGALGHGTPERDLRVSPQHRILIGSAIALRMFGSAEVLVPAGKLLSLPGVSVDEACTDVEYVHILCDGHQIVWAEGAAAETLFLGPNALAAMSPAAREEIAMLFPEVLAPGFAPVSARPLIGKRRRIDRLIARHLRNGKPLSEVVR